MSASRRGAMIAVGLLVAANSSIAADPPPSASESTPSPFVIEIAGLGSTDPLDRRLAELVLAPLAGSGQWTVAAEDRGALREAEADLALLASEDPARAMRVLRGRTSDFRIELGVQGSMSELEEVYGIATYAAEFEVSMTLVRSIDGRIAASSVGRGSARREKLELASEAALAEATGLAIDPVLLALDEASRRSRRGVDVVLTASSVGETEAARIRSHLPAPHRVSAEEGVVRIEPAPSDEVLAAVASASGWVVLDRATGVAVLGVADAEPWGVRTVAMIAAGLSVAVASLWLLARSRRGASS
ncbi:MAG: hypothetical protein ACO38V_02345 [Phycisphaerales bacterium]